MDTTTVDLVAFDEVNKIVNLIIIDDLDWTSPRDHIDVIHEKILSYVAFIENGTFNRKYSKVINYKKVIKIVFEHIPNDVGMTFIKQVKGVLEDTGYHLEFINYEDASN